MSDGRGVPQVPAAQVPDGAYVLDVRENDEWAAGHVPGAVHIPMREVQARHQEVATDRAVYVICRSGQRSAHVAQALTAGGWDAHNVSDGMHGWESAGRPMASDSGAPFVA